MGRIYEATIKYKNGESFIISDEYLEKLRIKCMTYINDDYVLTIDLCRKYNLKPLK